MLHEPLVAFTMNFIHNTLNLPTLLYGSENWTIKAGDEIKTNQN
jgi:hypothetical protein